MNLDQNQLLRAAYRSTDVINQIPEEILSGYQIRMLNEIRSQLKIGIDPSLQSVSRSIIETLKPDQTKEFKELVIKIKQAPDLDQSSLKLMLHKARWEANRKLMRILTTLEEQGSKEELQLLKRMEELKHESQQEWSTPISARDYAQLTRLEEKEIQLDIDWFRDNGVSIKSKVLYAIITMTNGGKTILKTWLAFELLKKGQNILFLAQEEPHQDTIRRIHQQALNLSEDQYKHLTKEGFQFVGEKFNKLTEANGWGEIFVCEWSGIKTDTLRKLVEVFEEENQLTIDGLIIDYAKLINANAKTNQEWERVGKVFEELKALAMKTDKWIITSMQLNRAASEAMVLRGTTPDLFDVSGAYEATHHVNYCLVARLINSDLADENPDENSIKGTFELTVQKQKYGNLRKGDSMRFLWTADHRLSQAPPAPTANDVTLPF
jgi:archaellum biogenesis ATPase FlaH